VDKIKKKYYGKNKRAGEALPFSSENYIIFGIGIFLIIIGYLALSKGPWDSFWSLTLAPILLVIGYCVVIPLAILYRKKKQENNQAGQV
jgi:general stress protein CsbA